MICSNCKHSIEEGSKFCNHCGAKIEEIPVSFEAETAKYAIDFRETLTLSKQIRSLFFKELEVVVKEEISPNQKVYRAYFDQFYKSDFYKEFDLRTEQLAEEIYSIHSGSSDNKQAQIDALLHQNYFGFIDHFLVRYCEPLHKVKLPEASLKYTNVKLDKLNKREMILDYLDFENEPDKVYTDFFKIPTNKVKNAVESFLFAQNQEKIYFICDQTIFGSCREGFAMTEQALHWKSHFNPPQSVFYDELNEIKIEAEWISINGLFFNVHKSINLKMLRLLKKLKSLNK